MFTSNVDGHFARAGFDESCIAECHGSIHHLQCLDGCRGDIWPADAFHPQIDEENCRLTSDFPRCPHCGGMARPNILMFGDWGWLEDRSEAQRRRLQNWLRKVERLLVIEVVCRYHDPDRALDERVGWRPVVAHQSGRAGIGPGGRSVPAVRRT